MNEVVVTGIGMICPLGNNLHQVWENLLLKKCATKFWEDLEKEGFRSAFACRIENDEIPQNENRGKVMALKAVEQAIQQANLSLNIPIGVFTGTTMGESAAFEQAAAGFPLDLKNAAGNCFSNFIQSELHLKGPIATFGTACTAGNYAIGAAANAIKNGKLKVAIAGGVDPFSKIAMVGFSRSRAMTNDFCRPFDENRNGMQLSEASAYFVLESLENALERGAIPLAKIGALGLSCDAYHPTKPMPDGNGMAAAMQNALTQNHLLFNEVDWLCAHGSGTLASDSAESKAIENIFGKNTVRVMGCKGAIGHSLGAATAVEAAICIQSIVLQQIPPTVNHVKTVYEMNINVVTQTISREINWVLNCGYAFGGLNSALLIGKI
jgi:3-oxoacyl-[acyl-carrier-protein] synthase II